EPDHRMSASREGLKSLQHAAPRFLCLADQPAIIERASAAERRYLPVPGAWRWADAHRPIARRFEQPRCRLKRAGLEGAVETVVKQPNDRTAFRETGIGKQRKPEPPATPVRPGPVRGE